MKIRKLLPLTLVLVLAACSVTVQAPSQQPQSPVDEQPPSQAANPGGQEPPTTNLSRIEFTFESLEVLDNPDGGFAGEGDFYWELNVNNDHVVVKSSNQDVTLAPNEIYRITDGTKTLDLKPGSAIKVDGWVRDDDGDTYGNCGAFEINIRESEVPPKPEIKTLSKLVQGDPDCKVIIHMAVRRV